MFPGEDAFESDNCRLTTTIGLGVVAMGACVSSRGAVNSSVQREREREGGDGGRGIQTEAQEVCCQERGKLQTA